MISKLLTLCTTHVANYQFGFQFLFLLLLFLGVVCSYSPVKFNYIDSEFSRTFVLNIQSQQPTEANITFLTRRAGERHRTYVLEVYEHRVSRTDIVWLPARLRHYTNTYQVLNVVAMLQTVDDGVQAFAYSPYTDKMIQLPADAYRLDELFTDKIDFNGRPLHVSLFSEEVRAQKKSNGSQQIVGPDGDIAYLLADNLNATLMLQSPPDKLEYGNPTSAHNGSGSLGQVVRREVDISLNSRFMRYDLFREHNIVEPTNTIGRDDMCIIVPTPRFMPPFHNLMHSLDSTVWILVFVVIFPITFLVQRMAVNPYHSLEPTFRHFQLLDAVRCYFNQTLTRLPSTSVLRCVIIVWIAYCFIMTNIFQSGLTSTFTVKILEKEINNIDDLIKSDYSIVASTDYGKLISRYFEGSPLSGRGKLLEKLQLVEWSEYNRLIHENNTKYAYANKYHLTNFYANAKINRGSPIYRAVKECPVPFLACYIVPFGSPLLGRLNKIIGQLEQSGIFRYWERRVNADPMRAPIARRTDHPEPLKLKQMFSFYFLFGGLLVASFIFLFEIARLPEGIKKAKARKGKRKRKRYRSHTYLDLLHQALVDLRQRVEFGRKHN